MIYSNVSLYADGCDQVCSMRMWFFDKSICIYFNSLFSVICNFAKLMIFFGTKLRGCVKGNMKRGIKSFVLTSLSATVSALLSPVTIKAAFHSCSYLNTFTQLKRTKKTKPIDEMIIFCMCCSSIFIFLVLIYDNEYETKEIKN